MDHKSEVGGKGCGSTERGCARSYVWMTVSRAPLRPMFLYSAHGEGGTNPVDRKSNFNTPTPEEVRKSKAAGQKANAALIKKQESEGHLASQKVWDYYQAALKKHEEARAKKK